MKRRSVIEVPRQVADTIGAIGASSQVPGGVSGAHRPNCVLPHARDDSLHPQTIYPSIRFCTPDVFAMADAVGVP